MLRRIWPATEVNPALVTLSHIYLSTAWQALTHAERRATVAACTKYPGHIGMSALAKKFVAPLAVGRKARTAPAVYTQPDDAVAYITSNATGKRAQQLAAAMWLMYTCGLSAARIAKLTAGQFMERAAGLLLVTDGYIYVLTPSVRAIIEAWLPLAGPKPFVRTLKPLTQHNFLSETYEQARSN